MDKYIDPTYDAGFKLIFGRENVSEELLVSLLNAIFDKDPTFGSITSVTYLNNEHGSEWIDGKGIRYDILCQTAEGHRFIVEMQMASQPRFIDRATFYVSRGIAEQGYKGKNDEEKEWDYTLKPVIGVFICNFHVQSLDNKAVSRFRLLEEETHQPLGDLTRYIFIQLPFFNKGKNQCHETMDQWIYNIKNMGTNQEVAFINNNEVFKRLAKVSNRAALSPSERYHYDADVKNARDMLNQIRGARAEGRADGFVEGHAKGRAEGRAEGHAEGRAEGHAEGRAEGRAEGHAQGRAEEKRLIAENLIGLGMADKDICTATGLSLQQIAEIRQTLI